MLIFGSIWLNFPEIGQPKIVNLLLALLEIGGPLCVVLTTTKNGKFAKFCYYLHFCWAVTPPFLSSKLFRTLVIVIASVNIVHSRSLSIIRSCPSESLFSNVDVLASSFPFFLFLLQVPISVQYYQRNGGIPHQTMKGQKRHVRNVFTLSTLRCSI